MEFSSQSQVAKVLSARMLPSHAHVCEFPPNSQDGSDKERGISRFLLSQGGSSLELKIGPVVRERGKGSLSFKRNACKTRGEGTLWTLPVSPIISCPAPPPSGTRCEAGGGRGWEKSQNLPTEKSIIILETKWLPEPEGSSSYGSPRQQPRSPSSPKISSEVPERQENGRERFP